MTRKTIISSLITALKNIDGTGTYSVDVENRVYDWRKKPLFDKDVPALIVYDNKDNIDPEEMSGSSNEWTHKLEIEIEFVCKPGSISADSIRDLITDVYAALGTDRTLGGSCLSVYGVSDSITIPDEQLKEIIAGAVINIYALYQTDAFTN